MNRFVEQIENDKKLVEDDNKAKNTAVCPAGVPNLFDEKLDPLGDSKYRHNVIYYCGLYGTNLRWPPVTASGYVFQQREIYDECAKIVEGNDFDLFFERVHSHVRGEDGPDPCLEYLTSCKATQGTVCI